VRTDKFYGNLQTLTHNKQVAFDLLKLALSQPTLPSEAIERMRQQAIVSAQAALQNPSSIGFRSMADLYFNNHPFAHPAGGTPDSLVRISRDDIVALRKQLFTRAGLKISAVGDISPDELAVELDDAFGSLPDTPAPAALPAVKVTDGPQVKIIERDIPQTVLLFGGAGIAQNDPDFFAAYVMSSILGGDATSSWLNKEVREKAGLTYSIDYSLMPFENGGLYLGSFSTVNENAGVALQKVRETLNRMLKDGPSQKELDDTKTFLTGSYALRYDTNEKIAGNLLSQQILGRPIDFVKKRNSLIDAVTLAQVQAQAKRLLAPDKLLVVAVGKPVMMQ
jgi:zinc protease